MLFKYFVLFVIGWTVCDSVIIVRRRVHHTSRSALTRRARTRRAHTIAEGAIKLTGGQSNSEGNVEIYHLGRWGSVCDDEWDLSEANVVCRALGFSLGALVSTSNGYFGRARKLIWMDNLYCNGNEQSLDRCQFDGWKVHDCTTTEAAGVICKTRHNQTNHYNSTVSTSRAVESNSHNAVKLSNDAPISVSNTRIRVFSKEDINIRLRGGRNELEGRIEVKVYENSWNLICGDGWGLLEAMVVCRQLDLGYAQQAVQSSIFGGHNMSIGLSGVRCKGSERNIADCSINGIGSTSCPGNRENVAGVVCTSNLPDLAPDEREIESSAFLEDRPLMYLQCAMEENCLASSAYTVNKEDYGWLYEMRRLLRFTARIGNIGTADFRPFLPKNVWDWHTCHGHYHSMETFAHFDIFNSEGKRVAEGHKASFCLEDNSCENGVEKKFACANYGDQGISVGCTDTYYNNIDCQWIDITELPPGYYQLKISINPEFKVSELSFDNNAALCTFYYNSFSAQVSNCTLTRP